MRIVSPMDAWKAYRHDRRLCVLPPLHWLGVNLDPSFDTSVFMPTDIQFFHRIAHKQNYEFIDDKPSNPLRFAELQSPTDSLAEFLLYMWARPHRFNQVGPRDETREEMIEGTKIFLRFIQSFGQLNTKQADRVRRITADMLNRIGGDVINEDHELATLSDIIRQRRELPD